MGKKEEKAVNQTQFRHTIVPSTFTAPIGLSRVYQLIPCCDLYHSGHN